MVAACQAKRSQIQGVSYDLDYLFASYNVKVSTWGLVSYNCEGNGKIIPVKVYCWPYPAVHAGGVEKDHQDEEWKSRGHEQGGGAFVGVRHI